MRRIALTLLALALAGCGEAGVQHYTLHSRLVGRDLEQITIRPDGAGAHPPLLVFLHGRGAGAGSNDNDAFLAAVRQARIAVLLPDGGDHSYWHDRADGRWGSYVVREAIPAAIRRLHADPQRIAIGGISMGGFGAYDIARLHPGRFCAVGGHSAALWSAAGETAPGAFDHASDFTRHDVVRRFSPGGEKLWLDAGTSDPFRPGDGALAARLGIPLRTWPGGHASSYWQAHYGVYLRFYARALRTC